MSPGDEIPMLLPDGRSFFSHGSSPATAITTGTIALMLACKPLTKAKELKNALLQNSDHEPNLVRKVENGAVLNVLKVVKRFCLKKAKHLEL